MCPAYGRVQHSSQPMCVYSTVRERVCISVGANPGACDSFWGYPTLTQEHTTVLDEDKRLVQTSNDEHQCLLNTVRLDCPVHLNVLGIVRADLP